MRFPVGAVPTHRVGRLIGEGRACDVEFVPNEVLAMHGGEPRLVAEGWFSARCNGHVIDGFEAVRVARIAIETTSTHVGLGPMELDAAHPDWMLGLAITPFDKCGNKLDSGMGWDAQWSWGKACSAIRVELPNGFEKPANAVRLGPVERGACEIVVEVYGVVTSAVITVK